MRMQRRTFRWLVLALVPLVALLVWWIMRAPIGADNLRVEVDITTPVGGNYDLFYDNGTGYDQEHSVRVMGAGAGHRARLVFDLPKEVARVNGIRIDLGEEAALDVRLHEVRISGPYRAVHWRGVDLLERFPVRSAAVELPSQDGTVHFRTGGNDPFIHTGGDLGEFTAGLRDAHAPWRRPLLAVIIILLMAALMFWWEWVVKWSPRFPRLRIRKRALVLLIADAMVLLLVFGIAHQVRPSSTELEVRFRVIAERDDLFQLFLSRTSQGFSGDHVVSKRIKGSDQPQWVGFSLPADSLVPFIRFDPGHGQTSLRLLQSELVCNGGTAPITLREWAEHTAFRHDIGGIELDSDGATLVLTGPDPYLALDLDLNQRVQLLRMRRPLTIPIITAVLVAVLFHAGLARSPSLAVVDAARPRDLVFITTLLIALFLPGLTLFHPGIEPNYPFTEKRELALYPPLEFATLDTYAGRYDAWYRDHFGFRKALYRWNSWMHLKVLHTSPLPDAVLLGKDGWLFQYNERVDGNYRGLPLYTFDELERIRLTYEERQRKLGTMGISYYVLIPPLAGNLHQEQLPDRIHRISPGTWLDEVKRHFDAHSTVPIIDAREELLAAKQTRPIYFKTDIHWNPYGAFFGYRKTIERIAKDHPEVGEPWPLSDLRFEDTENDFADLAQLLALDDVLLRTVPVSLPQKPRKAHLVGFLPAPGFAAYEQPQLYAQADTALPKLLMMHDSFGIYLRDDLSEHFSSSVYIWTNRFRAQAVLDHKPDVVIQELMEMFIPDMAFDTEALP